MKKVLLLGGIVMMSLVACQKRNELTKAKPDVEPCVLTDSTLLTQAQIDSAAYFHNYYAREAIGEFNFSTGNDTQELQNVFMNIGEHDFPSFSTDTLSGLLNSVKNFSQDSILISSQILNPYALELMDSTEQYLKKSTITVSGIDSFTNQMKTLAYQNLTGTDLEITLLSMATIDSSAYLWLPTTKGGSGIGYAFISHLEANKANASLASPFINNSVNSGIPVINWNAVMNVDQFALIAAAEADSWMLEPGIADPELIPIAWQTYLNAIGWQAAYASAVDVAKQIYYQI